MLQQPAMSVSADATFPALPPVTRFESLLLGAGARIERLAFEARRFYRAGVDVVIYVLPYHGPRTAAGSGPSGRGFFGLDMVRTNEAFAQAIYELRALLRYCRAAGTGPVGAFGMSLG